MYIIRGSAPSVTQNGVFISNFALCAWPVYLPDKYEGKTRWDNLGSTTNQLLPSVSIQVWHKEPGGMHP